MDNWTKQNFLERRNLNGQKAHEKMLTISGHEGNANQTTLRFPLNPVRRAIDKHTTNKRCWWGCGEKGTLIHCWWESKLIQPLWKTIWRLHKNLNIDLPYDSSIPLLGIYPKEWDSAYTRGTCTPIIHNSQVMEIAKMPHYWWLD
jgi:hypothetical protein